MSTWQLPKVNDAMTRRALEAEEAAALIAHTPTQKKRGRMPGPDRAILYAVAIGTGLRFEELHSLTPESFDLDVDPPTITCLGENTKNGRDRSPADPPRAGGDASPLASRQGPWEARIRDEKRCRRHRGATRP